MACRALESRLTYLCVKEQTTSPTPETPKAPEGGPMECNRAPRTSVIWPKPTTPPHPRPPSCTCKMRGSPLRQPFRNPLPFPLLLSFFLKTGYLFRSEEGLGWSPHSGSVSEAPWDLAFGRPSQQHMTLAGLCGVFPRIGSCGAHSRQPFRTEGCRETCPHSIERHTETPDSSWWVVMEELGFGSPFLVLMAEFEPALAPALRAAPAPVSRTDNVD